MKKTTCIVAIGFMICGLSGQMMNSRHSLYSDVKAKSVGDVITVLVMESANASQQSKNSSTSQSSVAADGSVTGSNIFEEFLPVFGASSSMSGTHNGQQDASQKEQLTGKISVNITEQTEGGLFRIHGQRTVEVNGEKNLMELSGVVRPRDIMSDNTVYSYNIADATITYRKSGITKKYMKPGTVRKWTTVILAVGLIGVAASGGI